MHWRISSFPELEHLSDAERLQILRRHVGWWFYVKAIFISIIQGLAVGIVLSFPLNICAYYLGASNKTFEIIGFVTSLAIISGIIGSYQYFINRVRGQLRMYLEKAAKEQPLPLCMNCGYNIEGAKESRCPECGVKIVQKMEE